MNNEDDNVVIGKSVGSVIVHMYEENFTGLPIFLINPENRHMLPVSRAIENTLNHLDD